MKKPILLLILFCAINLPMNLWAQRAYEVNFSEEFKFRGEERAITNGIIAEDKDNIYIQMLGADKQVSIQQFDKKSLKPKRSVDLYENKDDIKDYPIRSIFNTAEGFVVFFEKGDKKSTDVYAVRYDYDLHPQQKRKKIYSYSSKEEETRIVQRPNSVEFTMLSQKFVEEGERISVDYYVFDKELYQLSTNKVEMDLVSTISKKKAARRQADVLNNFYYAETGDLIFLRHMPAKDEQPEKYSLQFIDTKTKKVYSRPVQLDKDAYFDDTRIIFLDNELVLSGFYSDAVERKKILSNKTVVKANFGINGTFFQRYSLKDRKLIESTQVPFGNEFVRFISDDNPATRGGITLFKKKKEKQEAEDEDISENYMIRDVIYNSEDRTATFYCEYVNNYYTTYTDQNGNTRTTYTSIRGNLFYYQVSLDDGTMNWYNSIRRYAAYSSGSSSVWYIKTMDVYPKGKSDLVFYRSQRVFSDADRSDLKGEKIKTKKLTQDFFTASVSNKDGSYELDMPDIASSKLKPYQKVQLDNTWLSDYSRTLYTINTQRKMRPIYHVLGIGTCGCGYYCIMFTAIKGNIAKLQNETFTIAKLNY